MAPEYGATMGFFPVDDATIEYFRGTGRTDKEIDAFAAYFKAQGLYGIPRAGDISYSKELSLDLSSITPSLAGPKRPQDRIELGKLKTTFSNLFSRPTADNGYNKPATELTARFATQYGLSPGRSAAGGEQAQETAPKARGNEYGLVSKKNTSMPTEIEMMDNRPTPDHVASERHFPEQVDLGHGDVLIAAITSCTNTSNPGVLIAAGLLAKKAVAKGLSCQTPHQDLARSRLARGDRISDQRRIAALSGETGFLSCWLWMHHLYRQRRAARCAPRRNRRCRTT
jgi:aconitate hydratase